MTSLSTLKPGTRVFDRHRNRERLIHAVEPLGHVVKLWFKDSHTGVLEPMTFPISEVERRFKVVELGTSAFKADSETVRLLAESYRLQHAYLFNPVFATETSLIDAPPLTFQGDGEAAWVSQLDSTWTNTCPPPLRRGCAVEE